MALIKCPECGKEISDKAQSCPNCGCPIEDALKTTNQNEQKPQQDNKQATQQRKNIVQLKGYNVDLDILWQQTHDKMKMINEIVINTGARKSDAKYVVERYISQQRNSKNETKEILIAFALCFSIVFFIFVVNVMKGIGEGSTSNDYADRTINVLLAEDENVSVYLDHIDNEKLYVRYVNNSENDYYVSFKKLEINGDFYVSGVFVDTVYAGRELTTKLSLYTENGDKANYKYDTGTIKGEFQYYNTDGISFIQNLKFDETPF